MILLYPYKTLQEKVAQSLTPYANIIKRYSNVVGHQIQAVTDARQEKAQSGITEQNVALLRNAMEFWRTAVRVSDSIAPILVHYSWHFFNAFTAYSLFKWHPCHTKSHGITVKLSDELRDITIQISNHGIFGRLVDTLTIMGIPLAFSRVWPTVEKERVKFVPNVEPISGQNGQISLEQLLEFDSWNFYKKINDTRRGQLISGPYLRTSAFLFNRFVQDYLVLFVASSIARYRPTLWHSIIVGRSREESDFALRSSEAVSDFVLGPHADDAFVPQITRIFDSMEKGTFNLTTDDGKSIVEPHHV
jgi:hypothetical protein